MPDAAAALRLGDMLGMAAERLSRAGFADAREEALALWAALDDTSPGEAWRRSGAAVSGPLAERLDAAVARRIAGEPRAYVTGIAGFRTLDLVVDRRVLIPRPETEGLVGLVLTEAGAGSGVTAPRSAPAKPRPSALDLCTGSGCIALSLAIEGDFARIVATDISADALVVARANAARAGVTSVEWRQGSWFTPLGDDRFDIIVANPPYIAESELTELDRAVRDFEPLVALAGGVDGLDHTRAILRQAAGHLVPGGLLAIELDSRRVEQATAEARAAQWRDLRIERDVFGRFRYLLARRALA